MVVLSLQVGLMEYTCHVPKVLHNKSVNVISSSCIYKSFQSYNYEIEDCFYDEGIAQNHAFRLNGTSTNIWSTIAKPSLTNNTSDQFFVQCKMHIHYI